MSRKPIGYFEGSFSLLQLVNPRSPSVFPWHARLASWLLGGFGSPKVFLLEPTTFNPLTYYDSTGRKFEITEDFEFDGATTPRLLWWFPGFSPWDWYEAAAFHDWFYDQHHKGKDVVSFEEANRLLGEMVRTLGEPEWKIRIIVWAVNRFGRYWWDAKS